MQEWGGIVAETWLWVECQRADSLAEIGWVETEARRGEASVWEIEGPTRPDTKLHDSGMFLSTLVCQSDLILFISSSLLFALVGMKEISLSRKPNRVESNFSPSWNHHKEYATYGWLYHPLLPVWLVWLTLSSFGRIEFDSWLGWAKFDRKATHPHPTQQSEGSTRGKQSINHHKH